MIEEIKELLGADVPVWTAVAVCVAVWNVVALVVTVLDKRAAMRQERRTPERRFVFFAATLGGIGVLIGFYAAHHKTRKGYLVGSVWALTAAWLAVIAVMVAVKLI